MADIIARNPEQPTTGPTDPELRRRFHDNGDGTWSEIMYSGGSAGAGTGSVSTANTPAISSAATALAANSSRKGWQIQNVGINPLFILLGSGATTSIFHSVIKGGTGASDGLGGSVAQMGGIIYTGIITIAGTSPAYVVTEL